MEKAAAWRPRGRLSRRRAPSGGGPPIAEGPSDPPVSSWAPNSGPQCPPSSGENELWAALLRAVRSDPILDSQPLPPLPPFPSQEVGLEHPAASEVFTVGTKTFTWIPFPPARGALSPADRPLPGAVGSLGCPTPTPQKISMCQISRTPTPQEQLTKEGPLALRSCPLCQKEFTPELTQLDVDGHLAQCLAESTEDVEW
nr:LOW QUALITY PROTEIN: Fanconi anemia core complex-associated protein 20 [Cavia porcellus]